MSAIRVPAGAKRLEIQLGVIRAGGSIERGARTVYWHRNPLKRLAWRLLGWKL